MEVEFSPHQTKRRRGDGGERGDGRESRGTGWKDASMVSKRRFRVYERGDKVEGIEKVRGMVKDEWRKKSARVKAIEPMAASMEFFALHESRLAVNNAATEMPV